MIPSNEFDIEMSRIQIHPLLARKSMLKKGFVNCCFRNKGDQKLKKNSYIVG